MKVLEEAAIRRYEDMASFVALEFQTFEEIEGFASCSRRELFKHFGYRVGGKPYTDADLERVVEYDDFEAPTTSSRSTHDPSEYVELAEQGLNNVEIGNRLGVSEASVRRGLRKSEYVREAP